jgi:sarcosine oxidase subunit alpha
MSPWRAPNGGRIDRDIAVTFVVDGKSYSGHPGDTLASALLANGVILMGRSFKYHRPRGVIGCGDEEPNALFTVLGPGDVREPNIPATRIEIHDGLRVESQNRYPSLDFDIGAMNGLAGKLFSAGFYYKTFFGPEAIKGTKVWHFFEWFIRRAAGLGAASTAHDPARYERMNAFCDLLIVGAGKAGLAVAREAAEAGKRVIVCDGERPRRSANAEFAAFANVEFLTRTTVWGHYDDMTFAAVERVTDHLAHPPKHLPRHRHWVIRAREIVVATGALERPLVFPGNDRPGVMLASAARRYAIDFAVVPGRRVVVFTNNDSAYEAAARLKAAGAGIAAIVDVRPSQSVSAKKWAGEADAEIIPASAVIATSGGKALAGVTVSQVAPDGTPGGAARQIECDCLVMSGGWAPQIQLAVQQGDAPRWDPRLHAFLAPGSLPQGWRVVGAAAGEIDADAEIDPTPAPIFEIRAPGKAFVDFQHDVTADDVRLAHREGFVNVEHMKRYTTLGMATDQGRTSNLAGLSIMAAARGMTPPEVGTTRSRPPLVPVSLGAITAERKDDLKPWRLTPMHDWHLANGATMYNAGLWSRPMIYGGPGETIEQAYVREAAAVRASVGIVDVSTLGKIAVQGPDAAEFLDRVYTNLFSTLPVGKARYGLMLREDGFAYDDGTTWRLGETDFLMTTTTANAGKVMQQLEYYLDCVWPELKVILTTVTDEWAGAAISGPKARDVLAACVEGTAVDDATLPFMGIVKGEIAGAPVTICRLSFSGEWACEVYCGAGHGEHVWKALMDAGKPYAIVPYGLEALGTLRIEKGHVTGAEIDGRTTARDLGLDWMLSKKKPFAGSAMMDREGLTLPDRLKLVGLVSLDDRAINGGSHVVESLDGEKAVQSLGHVTAACFSPALGKFIALALVKNGRDRIGQRAFITDPLRNRSGPVEIVHHVFVDPEGKRMHG